MNPLVVEVKTPDFKQNLTHMVGDWKIDPNIVFDVLRRAADEWNRMKVIDEGV